MNPQGTVLGLSGEFDPEHAERLEELLAEEAPRSVLLDLKEVTLVERGAVRFLVRAEARGIRIVNCPGYVRRWMAAERLVRDEGSM